MFNTIFEYHIFSLSSEKVTFEKAIPVCGKKVCNTDIDLITSQISHLVKFDSRYPCPCVIMIQNVIHQATHIQIYL